MHPTRLKSPQLLAWATVALWAFGAVAGKFMALHSGAALFLLSTFCTFFTFQIGARITNGSWVRIAPRDLLTKAGIISSLGYGWYWLFYSASFRHSPVAALSAALNYTWPLFTAVFATLVFSQLRSTSNRAQKLVLLMGMLLGCIAVALVLFSVSGASANGSSWLGAGFGIAAGVAYGFYSAFSGTVSPEQQFRYLVLSSLTGMIVLLPFSLSEIPTLPELPLNSVVATIFFGILMDGLGYFVWTRAVAEAGIQGVPIEKVTSIMYVLPVLSVAITQFFFPAAEINLTFGLLGILLLTISSFFCQRPDRVLELCAVSQKRS